MYKNFKNFKSIDTKCYQCNGKCWHDGDQSATQKAAQKMFGGTMPNDCANGEGGVVHCPYALGLL